MADVKIENSSLETKDAIRALIGMVDNVLSAHVEPRVDTLANLLLVTDAGDGEVATASDVDARVVYKGVPSIGIPYSRSELIAFFKFRDNALIIPSGGTLIQLEMDSLTDDFAYADQVNNTFVTGQLQKSGETNKAYTGNLSVVIKSAIPSVAGTHITLRLQQFVSSWSDFAVHQLPIIPISGVSTIYSFNVNVEMSILLRDFRVTLETDDTTIIPCNVEVIMRYLNHAGTGYLPARIA